jgi:tetratricopeptide (TPR) repeat protein
VHGVPISQLKELAAQGRYLQVDRDAQRLIASGDLNEMALAEAYLYGAIAKFRLQEFWGSLKLAERAMNIPAATKGTVGMGALMIALNEMEIGDYAQAIDHLQTAMDLSIEANSEDLLRQEGVIHYNMALAHRARRDWDKANMHFEFAAHVFSRKGDMERALDCYREAAWCFLTQGDPTPAVGLITKIEAYVQGHPDVDAQWYVRLLVDKAYAKLCLGEIEEAVALCEEVCTPGRVAVDDELRTQASWIAGESALLLRQYDQAAFFADFTIDLAMKVQWPSMMNRGNDLRRRVFAERGRADSAS